MEYIVDVVGDLTTEGEGGKNGGFAVAFLYEDNLRSCRPIINTDKWV